MRLMHTPWGICRNLGRKIESKTGFESGTSPTIQGHGIESVKHRIMEAYAKIRQHQKPPTTEEERFQRRMKHLTLAALKSSCTIETEYTRGHIEITVPRETAEELIEALRRHQ
jgi:hypothetical protein